MSDLKKAPSVSVALMGVLRNYAERLGIDFVGVAQAAGFDIATLEDGRARISAGVFALMWLQIVSSGKNTHPGLNFGREMARHYPGGSILFTMMMNCPTIGCALDTFVRYHRTMTDIIQPLLHQDGDQIHLAWATSHAGFSPDPNLSEALISTFYTIIEHLTQDRRLPLEVCFTHASPSDLSAYRQVFKGPIRFAAERNELVFNKTFLNVKLDLANRQLFEILERHAVRLADTLNSKNRWSHEVMRLTSGMVLRGIRPDIKSVAKNLALSRRNLQAKLKAEETTFRKCLASVRQQIAMEYLAKPDVTIGDVAFLLGYSEQSAFNHAFKRWTGKSPKAYSHRPGKG